MEMSRDERSQPAERHPHENPWRRLSRRVVHQNPWLRIVQDEVIRPDGQPGGYGVVQFQNVAVGVVVLDALDRTLLVGQYRYTLDAYSWEIPEGGAPLGEDPLEAARRELREETGYEATEWRELLQADLSNSVTDERAVAYLASGLVAGDAEPEGTEQLELRWVPFDEALAMTRRGEIRDALSILALQALALDRVGGRSVQRSAQQQEDGTMTQDDRREDVSQPLPGVTPEEMGNAGFASMGDAEPSTVLGGEISAAGGLEGRTDLEPEFARAVDPSTPDRPGEAAGVDQRRQEAERRTSLWEVDPSGDRPARRLTRSAPGESGAAFLPDGSLLFLSSRPDPDLPEDERDEDEPTRLWLLPASGGEARPMAGPSGGVDAVVAARSADVVVFAASVHRGLDLRADRERDKARRKAGVSGMLLEGFPIRYWDRWLGPRERHLFAAPVADDERRLDDAADLTPDARTALVDVGFDVSPDGATVVTAWRREDVLTQLSADIVAIDRASGEHRSLTPGDAWYAEPAVSPDGSSVACIREERGRPHEPGPVTLQVLPLAGGAPRDLAPALDLRPHSPVWAPDGNAIYAVADREGGAVVVRVDASSGEVRFVSATPGACSDVAPAPDRRRVFALRSSVAEPPRVVMLEAGAQDAGASHRTLRSHSALDEVQTGSQVERLSARASDGTEIGAWLVLPDAASATDPVPLVVWVHGGPIGSWNGWHWRWNPHLMTGRGYAVLMPDPGLSTGYGERMIRRGFSTWSEPVYSDVMTSLDAALHRDDLDGDRTALMGGSYGGYMANWVAGQTERFRAIVTHASLWELRGFHGTTDHGPAWEEEFGDPYRDASLYEAASPHQHVARIRTPMLVIHGDRDYRVPISEGLRLWTDLQRHGVEAKFLFFPDENHWILKPGNARLWYETVLAFLDHHVRGLPWVRPALV